MLELVDSANLSFVGENRERSSRSSDKTLKGPLNIVLSKMKTD